MYIYLLPDRECKLVAKLLFYFSTPTQRASKLATDTAGNHMYSRVLAFLVLFILFVSSQIYILCYGLLIEPT